MTTLLRPRTDQGLPLRLARSAAVQDTGADLPTADVPGWLAERQAAQLFEVAQIPLGDLDGWSFTPDTGDLAHRSGRFFSVHGLSVRVGEGPIRHWQQPIICQPEVGILGILAKEIDGVLHFLLQAKMEPGNINLLQLSPTVQATYSNYTGVHRGSAVKYLDHFTRPGRGRILADVLQSEHGSWFHRKTNRNVLIETTEDVVADDDFRWLSLGQIGELLRLDNIVNMDTRTVLACLPSVRTQPEARHDDAALLSWFTAERSRHEVEVRRVPLAEVEGWRRDEYTIARPDGRYFKVVGVDVRAANREVSAWSQPLFEPIGLGVNAFLFCHFDGVPHLLVQAKVEAGFLNTVELAPTVQATPDNWTHLPPAQRPPFLDRVLAAAPREIRYEAVHSEEGGRFRNAESRYLFVETTPHEDVPPGYCWATPGQLEALVRHGHYLNVEARTLLACLNAGAAHLDPR